MEKTRSFDAFVGTLLAYGARQSGLAALLLAATRAFLVGRAWWAAHLHRFEGFACSTLGVLLLLLGFGFQSRLGLIRGLVGLAAIVFLRSASTAAHEVRLVQCVVVLANRDTAECLSCTSGESDTVAAKQVYMQERALRRRLGAKVRLSSSHGMTCVACWTAKRWYTRAGFLFDEYHEYVVNCIGNV